VSSADTIVALSTPPGRSGIGVIRLSGRDALSLVRFLLDDDTFLPEPNRVALRKIFHPSTKEVLDQSLITYFKSPRSFTGEDVIEISCHGSPPLLLSIIDVLLQAGARTADAGEFTLRALRNGRMNLTQAEAVRDLIDARTCTAVQQAARQLGGELSARLQPIKDALLEIIVPLESSLEFVEDDLPDLAIERIANRLTELIQRLQKLSDTFRTGRLLKDGLRVTLAGRPNVGKSSVFNSLLLSDRAIVTDVPGTTRDSLSEPVNIEGIPVLLTDTAGVREASDAIERIGIERTRRAMADADLIVIVLDGSQPLTPEDEKILAENRTSRYLVALNKCDLPSFNWEILREAENIPAVISVSAKTGDGLESLRAAIIQPFASDGTVAMDDFLITNARHHDLLQRSMSALQASQAMLEQRASEELLLTGLYDALRYLGEITGEVTTEDVLTEIFATFCIGK
jgi:tRNA modification GTPase